MGHHGQGPKKGLCKIYKRIARRITYQTVDMLREQSVHRIDFIRGDVYWFRLHCDIQKFVGVILGLSIWDIGNYNPSK